MMIMIRMTMINELLQTQSEYPHLWMQSMIMMMRMAMIKPSWGRPESAQSNGLVAQIWMRHQSLSKSMVPETWICESVLHNLDTPPPGVEFWRTEVRFVLCITQENGPNIKGFDLPVDHFAKRIFFWKNNQLYDFQKNRVFSKTTFENEGANQWTSI